MTDWWTKLASERLPDFIIGKPGDPYLKRWYIVPRTGEGNNVYLHEFIRDDDDRALHDHPWDSFSVMLSGKLREISEEHPEGRIIEPGAVIYRPAEFAHRLEVIETAFTLFSTGPKVREWGFHCPQGWRPWFEFVNMNNTGEIGPGCGD